jgi:mannose-6-phosphate isomerase-like protein (cupin superfamily)
VKVVDLGRSEALSNHLAIVQSSELPHRHNRHDSTVTILRGHGTMTIGGETRHVRAGAVMFIPRGVVHHYTNESDPPTVALVVYAPPFDGQDREIVTGAGTERSPERNTSGGESAEPPVREPEAASPEGGSAGAPDSVAPVPQSEPPADVAPVPQEAPAQDVPQQLVPLQDVPPQEAPPGAVPPDDAGGVGAPGAPASPDEQPGPAPGDPAGGETGSAPGASGQPEPSPGAVLEGTPPAPIPPAP